MSVQFDPKGILHRKRHCKADWLILQAKCLADEAEKNSNASALIYAALESRNSIEQLWFELIMVCQSGRISKQTLQQCRKKDGIFETMRLTEPYYFKAVQFTNLATSLDIGAPKVIEWDLRRLKRFYSSLNQYCHSQLHSSDTLDDPKWFERGIALVMEVFEYMSQNMKSAQTGILNAATMTKYARDIWEDFKNEKITPDQAKTRLKLVQPLSALERGKR